MTGKGNERRLHREFYYKKMCNVEYFPETDYYMQFFLSLRLRPKIFNTTSFGARIIYRITFLSVAFVSLALFLSLAFRIILEGRNGRKGSKGFVEGARQWWLRVMMMVWMVGLGEGGSSNGGV